MLYSKDYEQFSLLVKKYVELSLLLKIIPYDMRQLQRSELKLIHSYYRLLEKVNLQVEKDLSLLKKELHASEGIIISEKQEQTFRLVTSKYKGFIYNQRFLNDVLRADCEYLLAHYMKRVFSLNINHQKGG